MQQQNDGVDVRQLLGQVQMLGEKLRSLETESEAHLATIRSQSKTIEDLEGRLCQVENSSVTSARSKEDELMSGDEVHSKTRSERKAGDDDDESTDDENAKEGEVEEEDDEEEESDEDEDEEDTKDNDRHKDDDTDGGASGSNESNESEDDQDDDGKHSETQDRMHEDGDNESSSTSSSSDDDDESSSSSEADAPTNASKDDDNQESTSDSSISTGGPKWTSATDATDIDYDNYVLTPAVKRELQQQIAHLPPNVQANIWAIWEGQYNLHEVGVLSQARDLSMRTTLNHVANRLFEATMGAALSTIPPEEIRYGFLRELARRYCEGETVRPTQEELAIADEIDRTRPFPGVNLKESAIPHHIKVEVQTTLKSEGEPQRNDSDDASRDDESINESSSSSEEDCDAAGTANANEEGSDESSCDESDSSDESSSSDEESSSSSSDDENGAERVGGAINPTKCHFIHLESGNEINVNSSDNDGRGDGQLTQGKTQGTGDAPPQWRKMTTKLPDSKPRERDNDHDPTTPSQEWAAWMSGPNVGTEDAQFCVKCGTQCVTKRSVRGATMGKLYVSCPHPRGEKGHTWKLISEAATASEREDNTLRSMVGTTTTCLQGKRFVITGVFPELENSTGVDCGKRAVRELIEECEGIVTSAVTGRTEYLVVGDEPGQKKLASAKAKGVKTLNRNELHALIEGSSSPNERNASKTHDVDTSDTPDAVQYREWYESAAKPLENILDQINEQGGGSTGDSVSPLKSMNLQFTGESAEEEEQSSAWHDNTMIFEGDINVSAIQIESSILNDTVTSDWEDQKSENEVRSERHTSSAEGQRDNSIPPLKDRNGWRHDERGFLTAPRRCDSISSDDSDDMPSIAQRGAPRKGLDDSSTNSSDQESDDDSKTSANANAERQALLSKRQRIHNDTLDEILATSSSDSEEEESVKPTPDDDSMDAIIEANKPVLSARKTASTMKANEVSPTDNDASASGTSATQESDSDYEEPKPTRRAESKSKRAHTPNKRTTTTSTPAKSPPNSLRKLWRRATPTATRLSRSISTTSRDKVQQKARKEISKRLKEQATSQ